MEESTTENEIKEIRSRIDILNYISQFSEFKKVGNTWFALSPLKHERTPSFTVSTELQKFHDFSSGLYGDVIDFVRYYNHCSLNEALEILKQYGGITCNQVPQSLNAVKIAKQFKGNNNEVKECIAKVLPSDYMDRFDFNKDKLKVWADEGIDYDIMYEFGVRYDRFSDRIVFPIKDLNGDIINVSGRTLDPDYKEKGLRKYTYFYPLGTLDTIYGFSDARKSIFEKKEIILFEGAKSVLLAKSWGISNCGAILTSHLNQNQFLTLVQLGVRTVFALDSDVNVREDKNISKLKRYVTTEWVKNQDKLLEDKMSPVDKGFDIWNNLYERRRSI